MLVNAICSWLQIRWMSWPVVQNLDRYPTRPVPSLICTIEFQLSEHVGTERVQITEMYWINVFSENAWILSSQKLFFIVTSIFGAFNMVFVVKNHEYVNKFHHIILTVNQNVWNLFMYTLYIWMHSYLPNNWNFMSKFYKNANTFELW